MLGNHLAPFPFGRVYTSTQVNLSWLDQEWHLPFLTPEGIDGGLARDYPPNTAGTGRIVHRGGLSQVRLMKNATGGNIAVGAAVIASATAYPSEIADECATAEVAIGIVDPFLGAVVANGEYCVVITKGMCRFLLPTASADVTAGGLVIPHATEDGRIEAVDATPDNDAEAQNQPISLLGRVLETSDVENALVLGYFRGGF